MVVVVPAVAHANDGHEPVVHAVVFDFEVLVAPSRHVANDVENQRRIQSQNTGKQAGTGNNGSESDEQYDAEKKAADDVNRIAELPIGARLQKSVERVFEQIFALHLWVDVRGIFPFAIKRVSRENAVVGRMRIERQIRIAVMSAVNRRPPNRRAVECKIGAENEEILDRLGACESPVGEQSVKTYRHPEHMPQVEDEGQARKK